MRALKYRRRQDGGMTRVYVGKVRMRILHVLLNAETPLSALGIATAAEVGTGTLYPFLEHLTRAGWLNVEDSQVIPVYWLTTAGRTELDDFTLAPPRWLARRDAREERRRASR